MTDEVVVVLETVVGVVEAEALELGVELVTRELEDPYTTGVEVVDGDEDAADEDTAELDTEGDEMLELDLDVELDVVIDEVVGVV